MCNCRGKARCPMDGNCLQKCFVYQTQVNSVNSRKYYFGTWEDEYKTRYNNHTKSFRNRGYEKEIEISKYSWNLEDKGFTIKWSVAFPYIYGSKLLRLMLDGKTAYY